MEWNWKEVVQGGGVCVAAAGFLGVAGWVRWGQVQKQWYVDTGFSYDKKLNWNWFWGPLWVLGILKPGDFVSDNDNGPIIK